MVFYGVWSGKCCFGDVCFVTRCQEFERREDDIDMEVAKHWRNEVSLAITEWKQKVLEIKAQSEAVQQTMTQIQDQDQNKCDLKHDEAINLLDMNDLERYLAYLQTMLEENNNPCLWKDLRMEGTAPQAPEQDKFKQKRALYTERHNSAMVGLDKALRMTKEKSITRQPLALTERTGHIMDLCHN